MPLAGFAVPPGERARPGLGGALRAAGFLAWPQRRWPTLPPLPHRLYAGGCRLYAGGCRATGSTKGFAQTPPARRQGSHKAPVFARWRRGPSWMLLSVRPTNGGPCNDSAGASTASHQWLCRVRLCARLLLIANENPRYSAACIASA
jgi:hypothetical protein